MTLLRSHGNNTEVTCGLCAYFVRDGKCSYYAKLKDRKFPFDYAPFWVLSDCYSDKEQVRAEVTSRCATYQPKHGEQIPLPAEVTNEDLW